MTLNGTSELNGRQADFARGGDHRVTILHNEISYLWATTHRAWPRSLENDASLRHGILNASIKYLID
jgi:hypothetical protein